MPDTGNERDLQQNESTLCSRAPYSHDRTRPSSSLSPLTFSAPWSRATVAPDDRDSNNNDNAARLHCDSFSIVMLSSLCKGHSLNDIIDTMLRYFKGRGLRENEEVPRSFVSKISTVTLK